MGSQIIIRMSQYVQNYSNGAEEGKKREWNDKVCLLKELEAPFPSMTGSAVNHNYKSLLPKTVLFGQCFGAHC